MITTGLDSHEQKEQQRQHIAQMGVLALLSALIMGLATQVQATELMSSEPVVNDYFGGSVSLSGSMVLVGAYGDAQQGVNAGATYVFRDIEAEWGWIYEDLKLYSPVGEENSRYGFSVSLSGTNALIGSPLANDIGQQSGVVYYYHGLDTDTPDVVKLTVDGLDQTGYQFGYSVSLKDNIGVVGAWGADNYAGYAYVYRNLDTASGTVVEHLRLAPTVRIAGDEIGKAVDHNGDIALLGAPGSVDYRGKVYVFVNIGTSIGTVTEYGHLFASDGVAGDYFGNALSVSGNTAVIGAQGANTYTGAAYVFRDLPSAFGYTEENAKLVASDGVVGDEFGNAVSLSGNTALVAAVGADSNTGAVYLFSNLDTVSGTTTELLKITGTEIIAGERFGSSVSLDGDYFVIGSQMAYDEGRAYTGRVSDLTVVDEGNTQRVIDGISFVSSQDWIIGQNTSSNGLWLSCCDVAQLAPGKAAYIGQNAGSNDNALIITGLLITEQVYVGAAGNSGNALILDEDGIVVADAVHIAAGSIVGGAGLITGDLILEAGAYLLFTPNAPLWVAGEVSLDASFGIENLFGFSPFMSPGTYTLIDGSITDFASLGIQNWGIENAYHFGGGVYAYFGEGSLNVTVVPEPATYALLFMGSLAGYICWRRRQRVR